MHSRHVKREKKHHEIALDVTELTPVTDVEVEHAIESSVVNIASLIPLGRDNPFYNSIDVSLSLPPPPPPPTEHTSFSSPSSSSSPSSLPSLLSLPSIPSIPPARLSASSNNEISSEESPQDIIPPEAGCSTSDVAHDYIPLVPRNAIELALVLSNDTEKTNTYLNPSNDKAPGFFEENILARDFEKGVMIEDGQEKKDSETIITLYDTKCQPNLTSLAIPAPLTSLVILAPLAIPSDVTNVKCEEPDHSEWCAWFLKKSGTLLGRAQKRYFYPHTPDFYPHTPDFYPHTPDFYPHTPD